MPPIKKALSDSQSSPPSNLMTERHAPSLNANDVASKQEAAEALSIRILGLAQNDNAAQLALELRQAEPSLGLTPHQAHLVLSTAVRMGALNCFALLLPLLPQRQDPALFNVFGHPVKIDDRAKSRDELGPESLLEQVVASMGGNFGFLKFVASDKSLASLFSAEEWSRALHRATLLAQISRLSKELMKLAAHGAPVELTDQQWGLVAYQAMVDRDFAVLELAARNGDLGRANTETLGFKNLKDHEKGNGILSFIASRACAPEDIEMLIENGCDANEKNEMGRTPLMQALESRNHEIAGALLPHSDIHATDKEGHSVLMFAACAQNEDMMSAIIAGGADVDARDSDGRTALMQSIAENREDMVEMLAPVSDRSLAVNGADALDMALAQDEKACLDALTACMPPEEAHAASLRILEALMPRAAAAIAARQEARELQHSVTEGLLGQARKELRTAQEKIARLDPSGAEEGRAEQDSGAKKAGPRL